MKNALVEKYADQLFKAEANRTPILAISDAMSAEAHGDDLIETAYRRARCREKNRLNVSSI